LETERPTSEKSTAELLKDLSAQTSTLVHQEMELAKAEMMSKGKRLGIGAGLFGGAGLFAVLGLGALTACAITGIAEALSVWLSALIVGAALLGVAGMLALTGAGEAQRAAPPVPERAMESTKEDVAWLKTQARSAKP
jgi:cation transporter-like permease